MINELAKEIHTNNVLKGFYEKEVNIGERLALIHSEVSEALEADRKGRHLIPDLINRIKTRPDSFEEWRDVEGYEDDYEVSNLGRVRSRDMKVWNGKTYHEKEGRILSPGLGGTGYYTVCLKGRSFKVARLVGKAFCEGYEEGFCINHINGIKTDDYANNLEWVSHGDNNKHAIRAGLKSVKKILTTEDMCDIAAAYKYRGEKPRSIQDRYPVSLSRIKTICYNADNYLSAFEFELADVMIRCLDLSAYLGIDIEGHIKAKMRYNSLREYKHGKRY